MENTDNRKRAIAGTLGAGILGAIMLGVTATVPLAALVAMALWVLIVILGGGCLLVIETPSMGTAAPAGTLVVSYPAEVEQLRVGDVISFQPSGTSPVYTHRIQEIIEHRAPSARRATSMRRQLAAMFGANRSGVQLTDADVMDL